MQSKSKKGTFGKEPLHGLGVCTLGQEDKKYRKQIFVDELLLSHNAGIIGIILIYDSTLSLLNWLK